MDTRGMIIVFEGKKNVGKTTQAKLLVNNLNNMNIPTEYISFPCLNTNIGKLLEDYLKGNTKFTLTVVHLLLSANRWEMQEIIKEKIENNINVVLDTYYISGIVYSRALNGGLSDIFFTETESGLIKPDVTILLTHQYDNEKINILEKDYYEEKIIYDDFIEKDWLVYKLDLQINILNSDILSNIINLKDKLKKEINYVL